MSDPVDMVDVARLRDVVADKLGLQFDESKTGFLSEVLARRLDASRAKSPAAYLAKLEENPAAEIAALARELTVSETYFFRNIDQFRAYSELCIPERMATSAKPRPLRILSLGCATGEEAYTLSILARETVPPSWGISIKAVDINPSVIEKAKRGRYSMWALRETEPETVRRWFRIEGREAVLDESIRTSVQFEARNLIDPDPMFWLPAAYDVIFCRNMIMYLTPESMRVVLAQIALTLAPSGYLFLGHAETLRGLSDDFHLKHTHGTFYYQRREWLDRRASTPHELIESLPPSRAPIASDGGDWIDVIRDASARVQTLTAHHDPSRTLAPAELKGTEARLAGRRELSEVLGLMQEEQFPKALELVERLVIEASVDVGLLLLQAVLLIHTGRLGDAERIATRLLTIDELNAGAHYVVALCHEGRGDRQGAIDHDQTAVYLDASFAMPRLHLGLFAKRSGDNATARAELSQALILLQREDPSRVLFFGGGFRREALIALCEAELASSKEAPR